MGWARLIVLSLVAGAIVGCGGSGSGGPAVILPNTGSVSFQIAWGTRKPTRVVPLAAQSIVITIKDSGGLVVETGVVVRPAASWTSGLISPGTYTFQAAAFPTTTGTGNAEATGSGSTTIVENQNTSASLTLGSTVANLTVSAPSSSVSVGTTTQLTATATDSSGNTVLVDPSTVTWLSSDTTVATVSSSGLATAVKAGSCTFTATFNEVESTLGQSPISSTAFNFGVKGGTTTITIH
jgi:hypothetical protein